VLLKQAILLGLTLWNLNWLSQFF